MKVKENSLSVETRLFVHVGRCLAEARIRLAAVSETAGMDAQVLLAHVLKRPKAWLLAHPEAEITSEEEGLFVDGLDRLAAGTPLAHLLGHWEFYGLNFVVTPDVLIPRPETELLVDTALGWLRARPARRRAAEAGTGSGCIAVALAVNQPELTVFAGDLSRAALEVARTNRERHNVQDRMPLFQADLLSCLSGPFDLLAANLPYVPTRKLESLPVSHHEPTLALDGGGDGLAVIRRFLQDARRLLAAGGLALAEIEAGQGPAAIRTARAAFPAAAITIQKDLAGNDRLLRIDASPS
ncbi:MAG TPA: peptide chain release factor N(5)-glutamine methyltransferase [Anaerolineaceae bacterium]|nr:peptide chain release factor N(5)-glutamine methyltransferase [Anaerolineaceae bacterium]